MSRELTLGELEVESARERLEDMKALFGSPGWKWFTTELAAEADEIRHQLTTAPADEIGVLQGRHEQVSQILTFEALVDHFLKVIDEEEADANV